MNYTTDFHCEKNNQEHRTAQISTNQLIVRRGQKFRITVQSYSDEYIHNGIIALTAETGTKPSTAYGTKVLITLNVMSEKKWSGIIVSSTGTRLNLEITSSPNAKIGQYSLYLLSSTEHETKSYNLGKFILLFNPWCTEDEVFLDSEEQREEYVLNEDGVIYIGSSRSIQNRPWYFGQFEEDVIGICLKLLELNPKCIKNSQKDYSRRNDPVYISRIVTAMVNCCDDRGILQGRWNPPYDGGKCPWNWNGSFPILHEWNNNGYQPVLYGQCWVFAAVACTVLRCLGIPTRVVTNFNSAHDTNGNLTIDKVIDEYGRTYGQQNDSVWNFHVWVESWMARNDLKSGYNGWQVLDPTPQEKSEEIYCCGPTSINAIKEGIVDMKYDTPFVFAEVNADQVTWICHGDGRKEKVFVETKHVGQNISTKSCGSALRNDITCNYKHLEGSHRERDVFNEADLRNRLGPQPQNKFQIHVKTGESVNNGSDFQVLVTISNHSSTNMVCRLNFSAQIMGYNGYSHSQFMRKNMEPIAVKANEVETVRLEVSYSDYGHLLENHHLIKLTALATNIATNECAFAVEDITVINPDITIQILDDPVVNQRLTAIISYTNPLRVSLRNCIFTIEGIGLIDGMEKQIIHEIKTNETINLQIQFTPKRPGSRKLMVDFDCNQMKDVKGFQNITVQSF
ncbi:protein-glutamine gamma-glutamyltransferase 2-like [Heterodontus francisci]|uniref:protein-glutamine gamma-glutamyltransferase 2-like n=1 Tax=Heterodontus francisci TaxID=7792 RepID=UPI00355B0915